MSYILNIKKMIKDKSRVFIFIKNKNGEITTNINEAKKWSEEETIEILKNKDYGSCREDSLKYLEKNENKIIFNRLSRKYFKVGS